MCRACDDQVRAFTGWRQGGVTAFAVAIPGSAASSSTPQDGNCHGELDTVVGIAEVIVADGGTLEPDITSM
jgi:hypothetical protein